MKMKLNAAQKITALAVLLLGNAVAQTEPASDTEAAVVPQQETREQAETANREAVTDALVRMTAATRLDLDVELPVRASPTASGD